MIKKQSKSISFYRRRYFGRSPSPIFRMATCDQSRNFQKISSHIINSQKNRAAVGSFGGSVLEVAKAIFGTHPPAGGWPLLPLSQGFSVSCSHPVNRIPDPITSQRGNALLRQWLRQGDARGNETGVFE